MIWPRQMSDISVYAPEGLRVETSAADGLEACTQAQVDLSNAGEASCPNGSKIATAQITTPLLPKGQNLTGFVCFASRRISLGFPETRSPRWWRCIWSSMIRCGVCW